MHELLVRLDGEPEKILNTLTQLGYYKNKSEAVRAGLLELGKEYNVIRDPWQYLDQLRIEIKKKKLAPAQKKKELEKLEELADELLIYSDKELVKRINYKRKHGKFTRFKSTKEMNAWLDSL